MKNFFTKIGDFFKSITPRQWQSIGIIVGIIALFFIGIFLGTR